MRKSILRSLAWVAALSAAMSAASVHVWEKREITLTAQNSYKNSYTEVDVWVHLKGPNFSKRVYGFWDGGKAFRVRVLATAPGKWSWTSGSTPSDPGLSGQKGEFIAVEWAEAEKKQNDCRRGLIRPTANKHAFEYVDGTPYFLLGDTWWSAATFRYKWTEDDTPHPIGPEATFKDMVRFRKAQGFNAIAIIAAFPAWAHDGKPEIVRMDNPDHTQIRQAWFHWDTHIPKEEHNEGGRAFLFPGRIPGFENVFPDVDRINPAYFQVLDKKIDYLNSQGFIPFLEVARRDLGQAWRKFYKWPDSYARYIQYIYTRYHANNILLSPIHNDTVEKNMPPKDYLPAVNMQLKKCGPPPFGTLVSTNAAVSTLLDYGEGADAQWVTFHQIGNNRRDHDYYWFMTELFQAARTLPAIAGEPYYAGRRWKDGPQFANVAPEGSEKDSLYSRSSMYGNFLSGGLGGYMYGADGVVKADIEPEAVIKMWDALQVESGNQLKHLRTFAFSIGKRYRELVPKADLVSPNKTHQIDDYEGWAYCARTDDKALFLIYFEKGAAKARLRGAAPESTYEAKWFDPRTGAWSNVGSGTLASDYLGLMRLPQVPSDNDWALRLVLQKTRNATQTGSN